MINSMKDGYYWVKVDKSKELTAYFDEFEIVRIEYGCAWSANCPDDPLDPSIVDFGPNPQPIEKPEWIK